MGRDLRGIVDTSVVIARDVEAFPDEAAISVATLAELHFGVNIARTPDQRRLRLRRLAEIEAAFDALPIDERVARSYGALAHAVATAGRQVRRRTMDLLIAATAHAYGTPLFTRDRRDFDPLADHIEIVTV